MQPIKRTCCKRCKSKSVYLENDMGDWYEHCLICGFISPLEMIEPVNSKDISWPDNVSLDTGDMDLPIKQEQKPKKKSPKRKK